MNTLIWEPKTVQRTAMYQFMQFAEKKQGTKFTDYNTLHTWSINNLELFWEAFVAYLNFKFTTLATQTLAYDPSYQSMIDAQWFSGAQFNFAEKLLQHQNEKPALVCIDETGQRKVISFNQLRSEVKKCAAWMKHMGIQTGDRVAGVLCNNAYAVIAMLATTSIGAIWSSCSPDFGVEAIYDRLSQIEPKLLFICDGYFYHGKMFSMEEKIALLRQQLTALECYILCPQLNHAITAHPKQKHWDECLKETDTYLFEAFPFNHPLYILFSSGTTGKPKCILHGAGGTLLQHLKELHLHSDLSAQDTLLFYTTCGWMMWNWTISALALGTTLVLYDGSPIHPNRSQLFKIIEQEKVTVLGTSAKYLASIEHAHVIPKQQFAINHLRLILSTGSPLLPTQYDYVKNKISAEVQLASISGGTDIISCFALGNPILPVYRGEIQCIGLGMRVEIFNEQGQSIPHGIGELVCTAPFPSMPLGFWNDPLKIKYHQTYFERFPNVWTHGDFAEKTVHNGLIIHGRSDATLNPGGIRIGTAEIYRQLEKIPEILDSVVIGQTWQDDTRIVLFVTLAPNTPLDEVLKNKIRTTIRANASPRHVPAKIIEVPDIPRTINGKTVEIAVRQVVHGQPVPQISSLANPQALEYFKNREELLTD